MSILGAGGSLSEQVWTGLQCWPPDVSRRRVNPRSDVWGVIYHVTYPMIHLMLPTPPPVNRQTPMKHYLPATSFAGDKDISEFLPLKLASISYGITPNSHSRSGRAVAARLVLWWSWLDGSWTRETRRRCAFNRLRLKKIKLTVWWKKTMNDFVIINMSMCRKTFLTNLWIWKLVLSIYL